MEISIIGTAPSAPEYVRAVPFQGRWAIGDAPWRSPHLGPFESLVAANLHFPLPWKRRHLSLLRRSAVDRQLLSVVAFAPLTADSAKRVISQKLDEWLTCGIEFYDSLHLSGTLCQPRRGCCTMAEAAGRPLPVQVQLDLLAGEPLNLSTGASVAVHAFGLAALQGPERINLVGIDLPRSRSDYRYFGRWDWRFRPTPWITSDLRHDVRDLVLRGSGRERSIFAPDLDSLTNDFAQIGKVCKVVGTEVHVLSDSSNLPSRFGA